MKKTEARQKAEIEKTKTTDNDKRLRRKPKI
jgi:hypothetical protein